MWKSSSCAHLSFWNRTRLRNCFKDQGAFRNSSGVIDCAEKKLYKMNLSFYTSSRIPEVLGCVKSCPGRIPPFLAFLMDSNCLHTLYISRTTLWRRLKEAGYDNSIDGRFTQISDDSLIKEIERIKETFPDCGEWMVIGCLRSNGIHVSRHRVREIIRVQDPIAVLLRWTIATRAVFIQKPLYSVLNTVPYIVSFY